MADDAIARRSFLLGAGLAGTAVAGGMASPAEAQGAQSAPPTAAAGAESEALLALTAAEAAFISAVVDTLIPADELSPAGTDCGIVTFIDRQLASAWGGGDRSYRAGPYHKGKPEQGYQLPLTPREYIAAGIAATNAWSHKTFGKDFDRLAATDRVTALKAMEDGKVELADFNGKAFFERLLTMTMEGFFCDPVYGGNRDKVSWKMIGFPGLPATYGHVVEAYAATNKRYAAPPQSITDFS
jgi:gluconate 2-dehydrogenase gamma chain